MKHRSRHLLLLFVLLIATELSYAQKKNVQIFYTKALEAFNEGEIASSIRYATEALELDEWNKDVLYLRANAYEVEGDVTAALIDYEKITYKNSDYLEAYLAKAILYYRQKNYPEALNNLEAIEYYQGPTKTRAILFKTQTYGSSGEGGGISGVTSMQSLRNDMDYYKGLIWRDSGKLPKAKEVFKRLTAKGDKPEYLVALGLVYERLNHIDSAKMSYRAALSRDPGNRSAAYQLQLIDPDFEVPDALKNDEDFHYGIASQAVEFFAEGDYEKALTYYSRAIKVAPDEADYYASRGLTHEKLGNYDAAIKDYRTALFKDANFIVNHYRIGNIYYKQKLFEESIASYTIYLSYVPDDADILFNKSMAHLSIKQYSEACESLSKAKANGKRGTAELSLKYCHRNK